MNSALGLPAGGKRRAPGVPTRRLGWPAPRILFAGVVVFLAACFLDQLTSSGPDVSGVTIVVAGDSLVALGGTAPLSVQVTGTSSQGPSHIVWSTSDAALATVDTTGTVTGAGVGTVAITARLTAPELDTGVVVTHAMRVKYAAIEITAVDSLEGLGQTVTLVAQGKSVGGAAVAPVAATFSAPSATVAQVDPSGLVTAKSNGTVTVTAAFDGMNDQVDVKVRQVAKSIQFAINNIVFPSLNRDTTATPVVKDVRDSIITAPSITWGTTSGTVLSVTAGGVARALQVGTATITAQVDTAHGQLPISVNQVPFALTVSAGNNQTDTVGLPIAVPPAVKVEDAGGTGIANIAVTFTVTAGGGSATGTGPLTNASGVATVGSWTLGTAAGSNTLQASAGTLTPVTINATSVAGAPTQITKTAGDNQSATVSTTVPIAPKARLQDQFGNPVQGQSVVFAVVTGGGSLTGPNQTTNANGEATVGNWTLGNQTGANTLSATAGALSTTFTATATSATPSLMSLSSGAGQTAPVGTAVPVPPSVRVSDSFGNGVPGVQVTFSAGAGNGTIAGATPTTNANGIATVTSWTLDTLVRTDTTTATATGLSPVTFVATGTAGPAFAMDADAGDLQTDTVGTTVTIPPSVKITDQYGNPKPGVTVTFTVLTGGGTVTGATKITNAGGIATVTSWTLGTTAGTNNNTLRASAGALQYTFTATARSGPAASIVKISGDNQVGAPSGTLASPYIVKVTDQFGNGVSLVTINWSANSAGSITTPAVTDASGLAQALHTLGSAPGTQVATATPAIPLAGSPVIFTATANSTPTQIILFAGNNQSGTVNSAVATPPSVKVTDQAGNPSANVTVTFAVATGGGNLTQGTQSTNAAGVATVGSWTLGTVAGTDNNTMTATAPGLQGSPITFTASAAAGTATTIALNAGNSQTASVNAAVSVAPSVKVTDQFNNPVSGVSVTFAPVSGSGSVTGGTPTTDAQGVAAVGSWTLGTVAGANKDTLLATSGALAGSPVTFAASATPGAAATIAANSPVNQTDTVGLPVAAPPSALVADQFGNPVANVSVTFAIVSGGGGVTGASQVTNASGVATVGSWTLGTAAGTNNNSMVATSGTLAGSPVIFTASATNGVATQIALNGGNGQTAAVDQNVAVPPSAIAKDQFGNPVANVAVTFTPATGSGSVTGGSATTNGSGIATVGSWKLGTTAGANRDTLRATSSGLTGSPVVFTATGTAAAAFQIAKAAGDNQSAVAGTQVPVAPQVLATDQFGNPVAGVKIGFAVTGGGGSIIGDTAISDAAGHAAVGSWTLGGVAGPNGLSATSVPALSGSPLAFNATGGAAGPTTMALDGGDNQSGTVNTALATPFSVLVTDVSSNPVAGVTVSWATSGGGSIAATSVTNGSGIASATLTLGTTAGIQTTTASVGGLTGSPVTFAATATPGAAFQIAVNAGFGQSATVGTAVAVAPRVVVADAFGNGVSGVTVTFAVASGGGNLTAPLAPVSDANGFAQVGAWTLGTTAGQNSLTATAPGLANSPLTILGFGQADVPAIVVLNDGDGQTATVGTSVNTPPSVKVTDQFGNPTIGFAVSFAVASGGGSITGAGPQTDVNGVARVGSWTLGAAAGTNTLTATATGLSGSPITFTATGGGGPPSPNTSIIQVGSSTVNSGTSTTLTLLSKDAFGNPAQPGHAIVFNYSGGSSTGTIGPATDLGNGSYTASFTGVGAGSAQTLGATIDGLTVTTAAPTVTVVPGTPTNLVLVQGNGQTAQVNTAVGIAPSVRVTDLNSNGVSGVSVQFTIGSGGGSVVGGAQTTNASGIATVTQWTLGTSTTVLQSLSATSGTLSGSPVTFVANAKPGPFSALTSVVTLPADTVAAGSPITLTLQARDGFGNNLISGGLAVSFTLSGGSSDGSLCCITDQGNGAYTASYTGTIAGSPDSVSAVANGQAIATPPPLLRVVPGPAASLSLHQGDGQFAMVGTAVATAPAVNVADAFGNLVPGAAVTIQTSSGGLVRDTLGNLVSSTVFHSSGAGVMTVPAWILPTFPTSTTLLQATIPGSGYTFTATATVPTTVGSVRLGNLLLGERPYDVVVDDNNQRGFVATQGGLLTPPGITAIDMTADTASQLISTPGMVTGLAVGFNRLYAATQFGQLIEYDEFGLGQTNSTSLPCGGESGVSTSPAQARLIVTQAICGSVMLYDNFLNLQDQVFVGGLPTDVVSDDGKGRHYVVNQGNGTLDVLCGGPGSGCGASNINFINSFPLSGKPRSLALLTGVGRVFVNTGDGFLWVYNTQFDFIEASVPLGIAGDGRVAGNPLTNVISVSDSSTGRVVYLDASTLAIQGVADAGNGATGVAASGSGRVYVANAQSGTVSVLVGTPLLTTIARVSEPWGVAVNPSTGRVYVANAGSNNVVVIDELSGAVLDAVPTGNVPRGVAFNDATGRVYVTNFVDNSVTVINGVTHQVEGSFFAGGQPWGIAVNEQTNRIYVAEHQSNSVRVVDGFTHTDIIDIPVSFAPTAVAVDPVRNLIYVTEDFSGGSPGGVQVIDGNSNSVVGGAGGYGGPTDIGVNLSTGRVYLLDGGVFFVHESGLAPVTGFTLPDFSGLALAVHSAKNAVFVPTNSGVQVISSDLNQVVWSLAPFGITSRGAAVSAITGRVYLSDQVSNRVHILQN